MSPKNPQHTHKDKKLQPANPTVQLPSASMDMPNVELIRFDHKVKIYLSVCTFLFLLFVSLKWHNSSIPYWNQIIKDGGDPDRGLVAGHALGIRSDEWTVTSSFILAQQAKGFPVSNEALGAGNTPLTFGLPTHHLLSKLRPTFWGYYFLDAERAFAWQWNFRTFPFLIVSFLLLMLFTRNNFLLSLFGSIWLLLSSAIQWWSISTEMFTYGFISVISFIYILYSGNLRYTIANAVLFVIASYSFIMVLYPAYQVPFAYFLMALVIGYMIKNKKETRAIFHHRLAMKIMAIGLSFSALLFLLWLFYHEAKNTIDIMAHTVYPGKRTEKGGDFIFLKMFTDNFSLFLNETTYPVKWSNICELSSFLMLSPLASIVIIADFIKIKKADPLLVCILVFQLVMLCWLFIGFPPMLAKLSLFNSSPAFRTFFIFGFSNVAATILFLAHHRSSLIKNNMLTGLVTFVLIFISCYGVNYMLNKQADLFFTSMQVFIATVIFSCLNWLVIYSNGNKRYQLAFVILCFLFITPNLLINPLSKGLSPYYENSLFKIVSRINAKDPEAGWVVYGQYTVPDFLKAAGINCFNGVQFAPPLKKLQFLDTYIKNDSIYNRYAHIAFNSFIDGRDSVEFSLIYPDTYFIRMDPCSPRLYQLGIKYFLFTYEPQPVEVEYMRPVVDTLGFFIYKRIDI